MSQSAVLVATLVGAFVLYVAARGRLAEYAEAVFGPPTEAGKKKDSGIDAGDVVDAAKVAAMVLA